MQTIIDELRFGGQPVLVTAAGAGIGRACCDVFVDLDARLVIVDRVEPSLLAAQEELASRGASCEAHLADVSREEDVLRLAKALAPLGSLKALINVAGTNDPAEITALTTEKWNDLVAQNLDSTFYMCREFMPKLVACPTGSAIVNVASSLALIGFPKVPAYAAAKGGVIALTRQLAGDYGRDGVRVNAICPGPTLTPRLQGYIDRGLMDVDGLARQTILGRMASAREIANTAVFLASDAASFVHGTAIAVDGGQTIQSQALAADSALPAP